MVTVTCRTCATTRSCLSAFFATGRRSALFCELVVNVTDRQAAEFEVAVLNRDNPEVKFVLRDTRVIMYVEIPAQPFVPDHLRMALEGMCGLAPALDADLARRVGGRRFLDTADEAA